MCDVSSLGESAGASGASSAMPGGISPMQLMIGALKGAGRGYLQAKQPIGSPVTTPQSGILSAKPNDPLSMMMQKKRQGATQSPVGQPASTQAPQGSSTNDDLPNMMPGFGYRPQQGGFGDEDFLRKYFSGGSGTGSQGFNS